MNDFFAPIYEFFYYSSPFSDDLFNEGLYSPIALGVMGISLFTVLIFYYGINHPRFNKWYHWALVLLVSSIAVFIFAFYYAQNTLYALGLDYGSEYYVFGFINVFLGIVIYTALSFCIRWWSVNCSTTPIPQ